MANGYTNIIKAKVYCINGVVLLTLPPSIIKHNGVLMKKLIVLVLLLAVAFVKAEDQKFGKAITLKEKTSVSTILSDPSVYDGKEVLVEGTIVGVCQGMGCWLDVAGATEGEKIRVKVEDGEIVFPKDGKGKTVLVEGVVYKVDTKAAMEHKDKKEGEKEDCATNAVYQIKGLGAVIK
jgi:hypothetical protein